MKLQANTTYKNSMASCCKNNWVICEPIYGCCSQINIEVPSEYEGAEIIVRIIKPNAPAWSDTLDVEDGIVVILDTDLPEGFLNAYGNPYTLQFIDPSSNSLVWFNVNGEMVQGVMFNNALGQPDTICSIELYA